MQLTLDTSPPVIVDRGPLLVTLVLESGTLALLPLPLVALFGLGRRAMS